MLYNGVLITQASGRIADSVASRNRGGFYFRAMGDPNPNPPTDPQVAIRQAMTDCAAAWNSLPGSNQAAWEDFARSIQRANRIGTKYSRTGRDEFMRVNTLRTQANYLVSSDFGVVNGVPADANFADIGTLPTASYTSTHGMDVVFDASRPWWGNAKGGMLVYVSLPLPATRRWYKSPMTMVAYVKGHDGTTSPLSITLPIGVTSGMHQRVKFRWMGTDGQLSDSYWIDVEQP